MFKTFIASTRGVELISQSHVAESIKLEQSRTPGAARLRVVIRDSLGCARLNPQLVARFKSLLESEHDARLVTIEGIPGSFCEGLDLEMLTSNSTERDTLALAETALGEFETLLTSIVRTPRPVIALVDGAALGGGLGIAAAADLVIATPRSSFALPEAVMGLIPAIVLPFVAQRIGIARTKLLSLGIQPLTSDRAHELGLVDEITDDLESAVERYARRFMRMDARSIGAIKNLIATHFEPSNYQANAVKNFLCLLETEETRRRISRFYSGIAPWDDEDAE